MAIGIRLEVDSRVPCATAGIGTLYYAGALTFTADTYLVTVMAIVGASQTVYQVLIKATGLEGWVDGVGVR